RAAHPSLGGRPQRGGALAQRGEQRGGGGAGHGQRSLSYILPHRIAGQSRGACSARGPSGTSRKDSVLRRRRVSTLMMPCAISAFSARISLKSSRAIFSRVRSESAETDAERGSESSSDISPNTCRSPSSARP